MKKLLKKFFEILDKILGWFTMKCPKCGTEMEVNNYDAWVCPQCGYYTKP